MNLEYYWYPIAESAALHRRPLARLLFGVPLVLMRDESGEIGILLDRCPHRHAPLSAGRLRDDMLECPYHGWRFDRRGFCQRLPGLELPLQTKPIATVFAAQEQQGLIWACLHSPIAPSVMPQDSDVAIDRFILSDTIQSTMELAAENFLDGLHTHFVHHGWVRRDSGRQRISATVRRLPNGVEAHYVGEQPQNGLLSRLFEPSRAESFGRFILPNVAEIEYRSTDGLTLKVTTYLTPETDDRLRVHAIVSTRCGVWPAWIKHWVLRRLFQKILRQDANILALQQRNIRCHAKAQFLDTPLDLLGPHIRSLLAGREVRTLDDKGRRVEILL